MRPPFIVAIVGGSASGKTTFADQLGSALAPLRVAIVPEDAYYFSVPSGANEDGTAYNFDRPETKDFLLLIDHLEQSRANLPFDLPIYDFATHSRQPESVRVEPPDVLILEGMHCLGSEGVRAMADLSVFVDADETTRESRRIARDVAERGRERGSTLHQFRTVVAPMHRAHVDPLRAHAAVVVRNATTSEALAAAAHELAMNIRSTLSPKT